MTSQEVSRYYEQCFTLVNSTGLGGWGTRFFHRSLERRFSPADTFKEVIELGAAHGEHARWVRHGFDRYLLTDIVDRQLDLAKISDDARSQGGRRKFEFQTADAEELPFPDNSFDRSVHTCLLHHLRDPESALREMRRVVRPGGVVSIYLPNDPGFLYRTVQWATTGRVQRKMLRKNRFTISEGYLRALEHPNHFLALRELVREVFKDDEIEKTHFPFGLPMYDLNFFAVFHIKVKDLI